jgi:hypothetical protein
VSLWNKLLEALPRTPEEPIRWEAIQAAGFDAFAAGLARTQQNPVWHGEGDVLSHTRMVCEKLLTLPAYRAEPLPMQQLQIVTVLLPLVMSHASQLSTMAS